MSRITLLLLALLATPAWADTDATAGEQIYQAYCTQCHGLTAHGNGINAPQLAVQPRNHTDRDEMQARSNGELFKAIKEGGQAVNKSVLMPDWGSNLNDAQINDVIAYLRSICCEVEN